MEPSFWSWEKDSWDSPSANSQGSRNGAQLLELGKGVARRAVFWRIPTRNGAQLLELGKVRKPK